jgi:hypothetical protein
VGSGLRVRVAVLLLASAAILSSGRSLFQLTNLALEWQGPDEITLYEGRFTPLKPLLPRHGLVGYVSDRPESAREFYLTQYALAPVVVAQNLDTPLVVGNFFEPELSVQVAARHRLTLLRDFGGGVVLFRGTTH